MKSEAAFSAFVTNLGKYNEGHLVGEWVGFPTTNEIIQDVFVRIGIDGLRYEEYFISDYDSEISGLTTNLGEYENLSSLNYLAVCLQDIDQEAFEDALELGESTGSVCQLIALTQSLDSFTLLPGVNDDSDLGYYWVQESGCYDVSSMGTLGNYINYERFGRDVRLEEGGFFAGNGYVCLVDGIDQFDFDDIPDEYCLSPLR